MSTSSDPAPLSVGFISLGCAKNLVDSQIMAGALHAEGIGLARSPEEADVVLVNTCAFIDAAREESIETIRGACALKQQAGPCRAVLVAGCLPQRYREELRQRLPQVDAFIGLDELDRVGGVVRRLAEGETSIVEVSPRARRLFEPGPQQVVFSGGAHAYLKVAEGCNHRCAFCAIPGIRGRYRSRRPEAVLTEAKQLLARGFRELDLVSQDTTAYGRDLADGAGLPALLRSLAALEGSFWIKILYGYPTGVDGELLDALAGTSHVCRYLDVPVQHSHPDMLRAMHRGGTAGAVHTLAERARVAMPDVALRTTCLVGYPGETEAHFDHLLQFVRHAAFDHLGVFTFSAEEGTPAAGLPCRPAAGEADERRKRLLQAQREVVDRKAAARAGQETDMLLERRHATEDLWEGRTPRLAPEVDGAVFAEGVPEDARPGDIVRVRYAAQAEYDMLAAFLTRIAPHTTLPADDQ